MSPSYFRHLCTLDFWHLQSFLWVVWYHKPPYSAVDQLRLIGGLKGVNTMSQFEENNFWTVETCLSSPRSRVAQNQDTYTLWPNEGRQCQNLLWFDYCVLVRPPPLKMVGFGDLIGVDIAPVSKKWLLKCILQSKSTPRSFCIKYKQFKVES